MFETLKIYKICAIHINIVLAMIKFDPINQIVIKIDICNKIWYNLDGVVGIDVYGIFNVFPFVIDILIKKSTLISSSDVSTSIFNEIASNSDKQREFECDCRNYDHSTIITNKIRGTPTVVAFFVNVYHFVLSVMDTSSLVIELSIEFEAFVGEIVQLMLNFAVTLSIDAVSSHIQVRHTVCAVVCSHFTFVYNF